MTTTNIICGIVTVKLNHNITGNLPIELVCDIVSFTYKFQHQLKFPPVLQDIEDGTMCVLQTLIFPFSGLVSICCMLIHACSIHGKVGCIPNMTILSYIKAHHDI